MPNELLNIMRFFATGQALFDHGNSSSLTTSEGQKIFVQAEQLDEVINTVRDRTQTENPGGIDLNPDMLELQTQGAGVDFNIPFDPQAIQSIQIDGFSPVIFQIVPTNLLLLLGVSEYEIERDQLGTVAKRADARHYRTNAEASSSDTPQMRVSQQSQLGYLQ